MAGVEEFLAARDLLLELREDYTAARQAFHWPRPAELNWALDFFDRMPHPERPALWIAREDGSEARRTYAELARRSDQVACWLRGLGVRRGDRILLMLGNVVPLWETLLAAMKLGAVVIPATLLLGPDDLADRVARGRVRAVVADAAVAPRFAGVHGAEIRIAVGAAPPGWRAYAESASAPDEFRPDGPTRADDTLLLYFTSGTTSQPKLVEHTHASYPIGHLATMYALGLRPGDVHLNLSSPGWAKHAYSCFFAPWNAGATVFVLDYARFDAGVLLERLARHPITSFCAPPTVWRMLVQADLASARVSLREALSAGEPLNPEIIERVERAWGVTIRDFYGQTETAALVGNTPGQRVVPGSMGRPLPGFELALLDADGREADEGEICLDLRGERPVGLMTGYRDDPARTAEALRAGFYHTGDVARRDADGWITYVGRNDDVFKASDYRLSPFELESVLVEHPAVAEAAVVPSPDPVRLAVPKAFVVLAPGRTPDAETARDIFAYTRKRLAPYKRIRRLEFAELPKTISGKIRRVELRGAEERRDLEVRGAHEFWEQDFPDPDR
jgi:acetyl-CoA synthetase